MARDLIQHRVQLKQLAVTLALGIGLGGVSGCVHVTEHEGVSHFSYEWWATAGLVCGGVALGLIGFAARNKSRRTAIVMMIVGFAFFLFIGPSVGLEDAHVRSDGFRLRSGIWGLTVQHEIQFSDIDHLEITSTTRRSRFRSRTTFYLVVHNKGGELFRFPISDGVKAEAAKTIVEKAEEQGIVVVSQTEESEPRK